VRVEYPEAAIDIAGADCNFELHIVSEGFAGQGLLQRQKSVLALFKDELKSGALHALTIKANTPQENRPTAQQPPEHGWPDSQTRITGGCSRLAQVAWRWSAGLSATAITIILTLLPREVEMP
jgi:BolA protein